MSCRVTHWKRSGLDGSFTLRHKATMKTPHRFLALIELLLVFPATLFMTALFARSIQPAQYQPAKTARIVVDWFGARPILGLDVLVIALPLTALAIGCFTVLRSWRKDEAFRHAVLNVVAAARAHMATLLITGATVLAGGILAIVALHVITD